MPCNATMYGQEELALLCENFQLNVDDTLLEWAQLQNIVEHGMHVAHGIWSPVQSRVLHRESY